MQKLKSKLISFYKIRTASGFMFKFNITANELQSVSFFSFYLNSNGALNLLRVNSFSPRYKQTKATFDASLCNDIALFHAPR